MTVAVPAAAAVWGFAALALGAPWLAGLCAVVLLIWAVAFAFRVLAEPPSAPQAAPLPRRSNVRVLPARPAPFDQARGGDAA